MDLEITPLDGDHALGQAVHFDLLVYQLMFFLSKFF